MQKSKLTPRELLKRSKSAPEIVVIGPSTAGKSTLIYVLVNHQIIRFIKVGIGDKSQTTIIPCNFVFDERIEKDEHFALQIKEKEFSAKDIHIEILERLTKLFLANDTSAEDTIDSMDAEWFHGIFEPEDAAYHLGKMEERISTEAFKKVIFEALTAIEAAEPAFAERVTAKKKEMAQQKAKISEIRKLVFEDLWDALDKNILKRYFDCIESIGEKIKADLHTLFGGDRDIKSIFDFSVKDDDDYPNGAPILERLFDPFEPFSLIVEQLTLACRPRPELIERSENGIPLRFCLRDTMGLTQIGMDNHSIKDALDIALNCAPDSILLLMNLEERDDVLLESCNAIAEKITKAQKLDVPVNVIFTKADRILGNLINKADKDTVTLKQEDYDANIFKAIETMEQSIEGYISKLPRNHMTWLSLRYLEESIDPIQLALKNQNSEKLVRFKPEGLYQNIDVIIKETQSRILPKGITSPLFLSVHDADVPAIKIEIDKNLIGDILNAMQFKLTKDKAIVNGYTINTNYLLNGRSVVAYYKKLQRGQGHTTRANVYGNFSINMKAMLNKVLCTAFPYFEDLYKLKAVGTSTDNLLEGEIEKLVAKFDKDHKFEEVAFNEINPELVKKWGEREKNTQILHLAFKEYFLSGEKYCMVMDKVAFNLSYGNEEIRNSIDAIYNAPYSYDDTMRQMQEKFKKIFGGGSFADIVVHEIGKAMTELLNKMFIAI